MSALLADTVSRFIENARDQQLSESGLGNPFKTIIFF